MNVEELCKKVQDTKKADSNKFYEEEMSSYEYYHKYAGTPMYSVRKHLRLIQAERKNYKRIY